uniref:Glucan endo-1,3-beta-D-glucosidase n=1 Tax=Leersia perrieri TaxID=77586 RepID=A0A0D9VA43_9ORYZ
MAMQGFAPVLAVALMLTAAFPADVQSIGVCYGVIGNNLPPASDVVKLYKSKGIDSMRIYFPRTDILRALTGSKIAVTMDTGNDILTSLATDPSAAANWVNQNIKPYYPGVSFRYIAVGNEYATFRPGTTVTDDGNGLTYTNLFDAMVDAVYAALDDAGTPDVAVVVSESGWPSAGGFGANVGNAQGYNQRLIDHVKGGTPRKPGKALETYVFAMFNENGKTGAETERHFGLFNPNKSPSYGVQFH